MPKPTFDTWTTIFLFAAIQGLFVSIVLYFVKKENRLNNALLATYIFLFSLTLIEYVLYWTNYLQVFPHMMNISATFPMLFGVILFFYFRSVFENKALSKKDLFHLFPFVISLVLMLPEYLSNADIKRIWMSGSQAEPSIFHWPFPHSWFARSFAWIKILHMSIYCTCIFYFYNTLSKINHEVRVWFNWLNGLFIGFILSYASYFILVNFSFFNNQWDYMISFAMMFAIYFIAWFGYLQPKIFSGFTLTESITGQQRYKNSALNNDVSRDILNRLQEIMQQQKIYRENDLRLEKLADLLNVSKHHLSQVINEQTGTSFFEYINYLRIQEAIQLLQQKSKKDLNIIEVAFMVGFNNKVSFNTTFKKITGKTPTEFRKSHLEEAQNISFQ